MVITTPDGREWTGRSGVSDVVNDTSLTLGTKFRIGSITKSFTGMAVAQLVQEGTLNLDDTLENRLPGVVPTPTEDETASGEYTGYNANDITIRDLLHHTSGLFNFAADEQYLMTYYTQPETQMTPEELVDLAVSHPPVSYPENPEFHYANTNYRSCRPYHGRFEGSEIGQVGFLADYTSCSIIQIDISVGVCT